MAMSSPKYVQSCVGFVPAVTTEPRSFLPTYADDAWSATGGISAVVVRLTTGGAPHGGNVGFWVFPNGEIATSSKRRNRVAAALDAIQDAFNLKVSELASACDVGRRMIYQWRDDTKPRDSKLERIFLLERAAKSWADDGFPAPGVRLREPLVDGRSILDLLTEEPLDLEAIHFAGSRLHLDSRLSASDALKDPFD